MSYHTIIALLESQLRVFRLLEQTLPSEFVRGQISGLELALDILRRHAPPKEMK